MRLAEGLDLFILVFYPRKKLLVTILRKVDVKIETWSPRGWKYSGNSKERNGSSYWTIRLSSGIEERRDPSHP